MSADKFHPKLGSQATTAARLALLEIAKAGLSQTYKSQYDFEVDEFRGRTRFRDSIFTLVPMSFVDGDGLMKSGIFLGLHPEEVFELCLSLEAIDFLIDRSFNPYILWRTFHHAMNLRLWKKEEFCLPLTLPMLEKLEVRGSYPFGMAGSSYDKRQLNLLRAAAIRCGGRFDPNKLQAAYAFELIKIGLLLLRKEEKEIEQPSVLMVNPSWQYIIDDINGGCEAAPCATGDISQI